jgi:hypothetical protein
LRAFQALEKKFNKKHPKLENFKEPLPMHQWLTDAFFRLHRRRQLGEHGYQPLSYQEMADFAERIIKVHPSQMDLFYRTMEATDNAVLYDHYETSKAKMDAAEEERKKRPKRRRK